MKYLRWVIWSLVALFLFYDYFLRVAPEVMVGQLMKGLHINATSVGIISAYYFYAYAPLQIPVGVLIDRFGARRLLTLAMFVCSLGSLFFALAYDVPVAEAGRFLMGFGSAFAFVGMVYVCSHWFPENQRARLVGFGNSIGMVGGIAGLGPLSIVDNIFGWRETMIGFAAIGGLLAVIMFFSLRRSGDTQKDEKRKITFPLVWENLKMVLVSRLSWYNALGAVTLFSVTASFASLWAVPFLHTVHGLSVTDAGFASSMVYVGWIIGGPIIGYLSDRINRRSIILIWGAVINLLFLLPVIYYPNLSKEVIFALMLALGLAQSVELLVFTLAVECHRKSAKATSIAFTNCIVALGAAFTQPLGGILLDAFAHAGSSGYSPYAYRMAMSIFPIAVIAAIILFIYTKRLIDSLPQKSKRLLNTR